MKGYLPLILILLAVVGGILWIFISDSAPSIENPKYTIGTITNLKQGQKSSGLNAVIEFKVNDKVYENRIGSTKYKANVIGEKYMVIYEADDPNKNLILTQQPVFDKNEHTGSSHGTITRIFKYNFSGNDHMPNYGVEFEYEVNEEKLTKSQSLPKDFRKKYPNLNEGKIYEVKYWTKNAERSIINLDKEIK